eukprot:scaffold113422_cov24-Prasinocladus_malaysianus.AAC.1
MENGHRFAYAAAFEQNTPRKQTRRGIRTKKLGHLPFIVHPSGLQAPEGGGGALPGGRGPHCGGHSGRQAGADAAEGPGGGRGHARAPLGPPQDRREAPAGHDVSLTPAVPRPRRDDVVMLLLLSTPPYVSNRTA